MTPWLSIDRNTFQHLLADLRDTTWAWTTADVPTTSNRLGWTVLDTFEDKGAVAQADWIVGDRPIELAYDGSRVDDSTMLMTAIVPKKDTDAQTFLDDVFADLHTLTTEILGPPTARKPGPRPEARWRGPDAT